MRSLNKIMENPVYREIINRFIDQQEKGYEKYGTYINLDDYDLLGWIEHAQQEATDWLVYLEAIKQKYLSELNK